VKLRDKLSFAGLRQQLVIEHIAEVIQRSQLQQYGHVLRMDDDDRVKMCYFEG